MSSIPFHVVNGKSPPDNHLEGDVPPPSSDGQVEQAPTSPKLGGIEELLRASGYATDDLSHETADQDASKLQCTPSTVYVRLCNFFDYDFDFDYGVENECNNSVMIVSPCEWGLWLLINGGLSYL